MNPTELIASVKEGIEKTANVKAVFGEPYTTAEGMTIIPVATVKYAAGGGSGNGTGRMRHSRDSEEEGGGSGIGLGLRVTSTPLGYIEIRDDEARFVDITDKTKMMLGGVVVLGLALITMAKVIGVLSKKRDWVY